MNSRRAFLTTAALATAARAQKAPASTFQVEKCADGVWALLANPMAIGNCNGAVFELSDGLLVVDTHARPSAAQAAINAIRQHTKKPVKYVVITHIHGDHTQGMPAYRKLAPNAQFIIHANSRRRMAEGGDPMPGILAGREKLLAEAEAKLKSAATDREKTYWQRVVAESRDFLAEMKSVKLELPELTVTQDFAVYDKLQDVHVRFFGRGHTDGDLVVYSPQKRVLAAGDLVVSTTPNLGGSVKDYPRTLVAIAQECPFDKGIPGHGSVQNGMTAIHGLSNYIEELMMLGERSRERKPFQASDLKSLASGHGRFMAENTWKWRFLAPEIQNADQALAAGIALNSNQVYNAVK